VRWYASPIASDVLSLSTSVTSSSKTKYKIYRATKKRGLHFRLQTTARQEKEKKRKDKRNLQDAVGAAV